MTAPFSSIGRGAGVTARLRIATPATVLAVALVLHASGLRTRHRSVSKMLWGSRTHVDLEPEDARDYGVGQEEMCQLSDTTVGYDKIL